MKYKYIIMIPLIISILAPIANCIQMIPQLIKTYNTKKVNDLSFYSLMLILITNILWFTHGYFIMDMSLLAAGFISITINFILFIILFHSGKTISTLSSLLHRFTQG